MKRLLLSLLVLSLFIAGCEKSVQNETTTLSKTELKKIYANEITARLKSQKQLKSTSNSLKNSSQILSEFEEFNPVLELDGFSFDNTQIGVGLISNEIVPTFATISNLGTPDNLALTSFMLSEDKMFSIFIRTNVVDPNTYENKFYSVSGKLIGSVILQNNEIISKNAVAMQPWE